MRAHVEKSKKYELDKFLINKIYKIEEKHKKEYRLNKKNVVYDKELTEQYDKYSNSNNKSYYSNYQSFRDFLSSGYNYDFLTNEINEVKSILGFSKEVREVIKKRCNPEPNKYFLKQNDINESNEKGNNDLEKLLTGLRNPVVPRSTTGPHFNKGAIKRISTVFNVDKSNPNIIRMMPHKGNNTIISNNSKKNEINDFIDICKLLKLKEEEYKNPINQYQFRLFSVLSKNFDPFYLPVYENFMNVKYENQKNKLIKLYNQELAFIDCVTSIKNKLKLHLKKIKKNSMEDNNLNIMINQDPTTSNMVQHKFQERIPYVNAFYFYRVEDHFKSIDNFMSMYKENISLASKNQEKDFFENLFKVLTYNNADCKKFLQYLYSQSYFFKYIYNIFTIQNKPNAESAKNIAPTIMRLRYGEDKHFINDSSRNLFVFDSKIPSNNKRFLDDTLADQFLGGISEFQETPRYSGTEGITEVSTEDLDSLAGNKFFYKINIIEDDLANNINQKNYETLKNIINDTKSVYKDYLLTLNEIKNVLQIINPIKTPNSTLRKKSEKIPEKYLLNENFDEVHFYDIEKYLTEPSKDLKYILVCAKNINSDEISHAFIFKIEKAIFDRISKSLKNYNKKIVKANLDSDFMEDDSISKEKSKKSDEDKKLVLSSDEENESLPKKKDLGTNKLTNKGDKISIRRNDQKKFTFAGGELGKDYNDVEDSEDEKKDNKVEEEKSDESEEESSKQKKAESESKSEKSKSKKSSSENDDWSESESESKKIKNKKKLREEEINTDKVEDKKEDNKLFSDKSESKENSKGSNSNSGSD